MAFFFYMKHERKKYHEHIEIACSAVMPKLQKILMKLFQNYFKCMHFMPYDRFKNLLFASVSESCYCVYPEQPFASQFDLEDTQTAAASMLQGLPTDSNGRHHFAESCFILWRPLSSFTRQRFVQ